MIVPTPLPTTPVSGIANSATLAFAVGRAADPTLLITPESTRVSLSGIAQRVLSQLADDPTLDIDTAFERSVFDLADDTANDGQLFSSTGRLQPFVPSPSLPVSSTPPEGTVDTQTPLDVLLGADPANAIGSEPALPVPIDPNAPATGGDTGIALPAAAPGTTPLTASVAGLVTTATAATGPAGTPATVTNDATTTTIAATTVPTPPATTNPIDAQRAAGTVPRDLDTNADADLDPATISNLTLTDAIEADPFQQAALIAGLTSFGKEQFGFVAGTPDNDAVVRELAAVAPVRERRDQSTEEWLNARRDTR